MRCQECFRQSVCAVFSDPYYSLRSFGNPRSTNILILVITKNGVQKITGPTKSLLDIAGEVSDKKITDEEILKILETPISKKSKSKKK